MKSKCKSCGSCGMAMEKAEDFTMGDSSQEYCRYCTDKSGKLLPFEKVLKINANYYVESQGVTSDAAAKMAKEMLMAQPAWKNI